MAFGNASIPNHSPTGHRMRRWSQENETLGQRPCAAVQVGCGHAAQRCRAIYEVRLQLKERDPAMKIVPTIAAGLCAALLSPLAAKATTPIPTTGFYRAVTYITAATPAATCKVLGQNVGASEGAVFYYPGASATGAVLSFADALHAQIFKNIFPKTPAAGAATWTGSFLAGNDPGPYLTIPFTAQITYIDTQNFTVVMKANVKVGTDKCALTQNIVFSLTGT
jgi:hypothetical protein